ncbi:hypothetical protein F5Y04DRAFT_281278 [Hypomontagnella monticulosa]|nr:hypothetical protein F5Y04DRAFT_281278 [Hypomontagnella monticulosa]
MQFFALITSLIAAATCVSALPAALLAKREIGGVTNFFLANLQILICNGANATGPCHYEVYSMNDCHDMPEGFSAKTKTFAPDGDRFFCFPKVGRCDEICTSPTGCTFGSVDFNSPVKYDLSKIQWDHLIESFRCNLNTTAA